MRELYDSAIKKVQDTGFKVIFTVCDQEGVHRSLFQTLGMTKEDPSFIVNEERVHFFYDSPHLLKSLRNTILKYRLKAGGKVISWEHIKNFYLKDHELKIRLAPKLTNKYMCEEGFSKMRVSLAAQVMSRTVAAGIYTHSIAGLLPQEAVYTAEFVYQVDRLFDCFNSAVMFHYKGVRGGLSHKSCHLEFIKEIKSYIKSWEVCAPPHVHIHCIDGWLINLASLEALWQDLQSHKVKYLLTRRLNQDCLENLYAKLRIRFGSCDHPSAYNFMKGLKSLMTHDLFSLPSTSNCEADESQFLDVISTWEPDYPLATSSDSDSDSEDTVVDRMPLVERNALVYIAGWTCKKFLRSHDCQNCRENLLDVSRQFDSSSKMFCFFKGENLNVNSDFGGLSIPHASVEEHFLEVEARLRGSMEKVLLGRRVSQTLLSILENHNFVTPLHLCSSHLTKSIHFICIKLRIHYTLKWRNKEQTVRKKRKNRKLLKLNH